MTLACPCEFKGIQKGVAGKGYEYVYKCRRGESFCRYVVPAYTLNEANNLVCILYGDDFSACVNWVDQVFGSIGSGGCFPPGTMVRMADGSKKQIDTILPGESVAAYSYVDQATTTREVLRVRFEAGVNLYQINVEQFGHILASGDQSLVTPYGPVKVEYLFSGAQLITNRHQNGEALEARHAGLRVSRSQEVSDVWSLDLGDDSGFYVEVTTNNGVDRSISYDVLVGCHGGGSDFSDKKK